MLIQANAVEIPLADESVHMCVTSPPYWGLRSYEGQQSYIWGGDAECEHEWGEEIIPKTSSSWDTFDDYRDGRSKTTTGTRKGGTESMASSQGSFCLRCHAWYGALGLEPSPELYVEHMVEIFREVRRVLRSDGTCWLNIGDSYNSNASNQQYVNGLHGGSAGMGRHNKQVDTLKPKDLCMIPARVALALQADGWWIRSDIIWSKPNPMPESVTDRPTKAHEYLFLMSKSARYYYDADAVREDASDWGTRNREHGKYTSGDVPILGGPHSGFQDCNWATRGRNRRTVWHIATAPYSGAHFATYPPALIEPCIKAGTSERGVCPQCGKQWVRNTERISQCNVERGSVPSSFRALGQPQQAGVSVNVTTLGFSPSCTCDAGEPVPAVILDPFMGSGTTALVARQLGRRAVGLDLSWEYLQLARERLGLDRLDAWQNGTPIPDTNSLEGLPMFESED